jgi:hypothetical protein
MTGPPDEAGRHSHHLRVKQLFLAALDVPRGRRAGFLAEACAGDESLQREVLELFLLHGEQDSVLDAPLDGAEALAGLTPRAEGMVGPWRLVRELGRGGMGVVSLAEHAERPGVRAAVKLLTAGAVSPEVRERFRLEAEILSRLSHPGIARVLDSGEMTGPGGVPQPWIAMDYVEGLPLREYVTRNGLGLAARVALLAAVCDAVQHAHVHGIVHRDLKPSNILVRADGRPVVVDFGVARLMTGDERPTELATRTGQLVGTPQYMSPEQVQAEPAGIGPASDVYSLGIIAYEVLSERLPYEASSVSLHRAVVSILTLDPPPLGQVAPTLRGPLERIVAMALEKDPRERYADAGGLAEDLRRQFEGRTVRARGPGFVRRLQRWSRRRRRLVAGSLGVLLAAALFTAWWLGTGRSVPRARVLAAYREAESLVVQGTAVLYEGERTPARMQQAIDLYTRARALLGQVPALRHHDLLMRRLEKDLGTAEFLLGELTWDSSPYHSAIVTLEHAAAIPAGPVAHWRDDLQVAELGDLETPQTDLIGINAAAQLGLFRLRGQPATLDAASGLVALSRSENVRRWGPPATLAGRSVAVGDPFAYCYNSLAEVTTERARFDSNPVFALAALSYSDSAYARRIAFSRNWPGLGSLLYERGRAFRTLGELSRSPAAMDSALAYLQACMDFRGPNRPWVFAQTHEELALLRLGRARLDANAPERATPLVRARGDVDTALRVLATSGLAPAASAALRSLDAELLIELALASRQSALLDSAQARLRESSSAFPATTLPRNAALGWVRQAMLARARYELSGDRAQLDGAAQALDRAGTLTDAASDSMLLIRIQVERRAAARELAARP